MANENNNKIPCGGFYLGDGLALSKDGKTLNVTGGGSQADWNQNDETAVDYVKNRPGGYDIKELVTVTDETATSGQLLTNYSAVNTFFQKHVGETVVVTFDGTPYQCAIIDDGSGGYHVGGPNFVEYPFYIRSFIRVGSNPYDPVYLYTAIAGESHTVKIEGYATTPVVFDRKYLPDLKTLTNAQLYHKNSYLVCDQNSAVRWEDIDNSDSLIAPKSYVDARITQKEVILESSTGGSSKKFKITVDDSGTIKATEVTNN